MNTSVLKLANYHINGYENLDVAFKSFFLLLKTLLVILLVSYSLIIDR